MPSPSLRRPLVSRGVLVTGALLATGASLLALLAGRTGGGLRVDNAFVTGHVTRLISPETGVVDVVQLAPRQHVQRGTVAFVINRAEHQLAVDAAADQLRAAIRDELQQCALKRSLDYRAELARTSHRRYAHKRGQTAQLAAHGLVASEDLSDALFDEKQATLNRDLATLEARRAAFGSALPPGLRRNVAVALNALRVARTKLERATLRVASDAYVFDVPVQPGLHVEQGALLAVTVPDEALTIQANVLEAQLPLVRPGSEAEVSFDSRPELGRLRGHVTSIVPAAAAAFSPIPRGNVDSTWVKVSQRVPVFITVDEAAPVEKRPPAGTSAEVVLRAAGDAPATPTEAPVAPAADEDRSAAELRAMIDALVEDELKRGAALLAIDPRCQKELRPSNWEVTR